MSDSYNSIFDTYRRFDSIFDIYPDKFHTGAIYGYRKPDGTLLEFPCTLDVSRAVKDDKGRWTASGLGLKPVFVKYSDNLKRVAKRTDVKGAWIGDGFAGGRMRSPLNNTIEEVRFLDDVTSIGCGAFEIFTALTSITIPNSVTSIEEEAFWGCESLTDIYVNQAESTLLDSASVSYSCTIHWNSTPFNHQ